MERGAWQATVYRITESDTPMWLTVFFDHLHHSNLSCHDFKSSFCFAFWYIQRFFFPSKNLSWDFPGGAVDNQPANAGVQSLVWEGPTSHRATEPTCLNSQSLCAEGLCSATRKATATRGRLTAPKSSPHSLQLEKACRSSEDPVQPKINK